MSTLELPIGGMDCAACAKKVQRALRKLPGVENVEVLLSAEKAIIDLDPKMVTRDTLAATADKVGFTSGELRSNVVPGRETTSG